MNEWYRIYMEGMLDGMGNTLRSSGHDETQIRSAQDRVRKAIESDMRAQFEIMDKVERIRRDYRSAL